MSFRISSKLQFLLCAITLVQASFGQGAVGSIAGNVIDGNGKVITGTGSSIHMKNTATGMDYKVAISSKGDYQLTGLPAGTYDLTVPMGCCLYLGYAEKSVVVKAGEAIHL